MTHMTTLSPHHHGSGEQHPVKRSRLSPRWSCFIPLYCWRKKQQKKQQQQQQQQQQKQKQKVCITFEKQLNSRIPHRSRPTKNL